MINNKKDILPNTMRVIVLPYTIARCGEDQRSIGMAFILFNYYRVVFFSCIKTEENGG